MLSLMRAYISAQSRLELVGHDNITCKGSGQMFSLIAPLDTVHA